MSWSKDVICILRVLINDVDESTYTDDRLESLAIIAATYVKNDTKITNTIDIANITITPEPDDDINLLIALKSACLLTSSEAKTSVNGNVKIVDGPSTIETKGEFKNLKEMAESFCSEYKKALVQYLSGTNGGYVSTTPYGPDYYGP